MDNENLLQAIRQVVEEVVEEKTRQIVREELAPLQREQEKINLRLDKIENERLDKMEKNLEYALRWLDRMEQRLTPVADYVETMFLEVKHPQ